MDRHPKANEFMIPPKPLSPDELLDSMRNDDIARTNVDKTETKIKINYDPWERYAVVDANGEAVGLVQYYTEAENETKLRKITEIPENALVLEVSYKKLFKDWPKGKWWVRSRPNMIDQDNKGVAASGIRQTVILLKQREQTIADHMKENPRPIYISAYTDPRNVASEKVLEATGFKKIASEILDEENVEDIENMWVKQVS